MKPRGFAPQHSGKATEGQQVSVAVSGQDGHLMRISDLSDKSSMRMQNSVNIVHIYTYIYIYIYLFIYLFNYLSVLFRSVPYFWTNPTGEKPSPTLLWPPMVCCEDPSRWHAQRHAKRSPEHGRGAPFHWDDHLPYECLWILLFDGHFGGIPWCIPWCIPWYTLFSDTPIWFKFSAYQWTHKIGGLMMVYVSFLVLGSRTIHFVG